MISRIEDILNSNVSNMEYDGPVESRIEQLLLDAMTTNKTSWSSLDIDSDIITGDLNYKYTNGIVNVVGKKIIVLFDVKKVTIGMMNLNYLPKSDVKVLTNVTDVFAIVSSDGTISLEHATGTLSTSDSYTFSATYLT